MGWLTNISNMPPSTFKAGEKLRKILSTLGLTWTLSTSSLLQYLFVENGKSLRVNKINHLWCQCSNLRMKKRGLGGPYRLLKGHKIVKVGKSRGMERLNSL